MICGCGKGSYCKHDMAAVDADNDRLRATIARMEKTHSALLDVAEAAEAMIDSFDGDGYSGHDRLEAALDRLEEVRRDQ